MLVFFFKSLTVESKWMEKEDTKNYLIQISHLH